MSTDTNGFLRNFKLRNANDIFDYINSDEANIYVFLGKLTEWDDEENPPEIVNSLEEEYRIWNHISGLKRILLNDAALGFRRINWERKRVFDEYDNTVDMSDKDFYCITDENNVYKCISNAGGSPSRIKPTHTKYGNISNEADGYKWKYMFTVSQSLIDKFIAPNFISLDIDPVVIENAEPGTIDNIKIIEGGQGYRSNADVLNEDEIPVFIKGNGDQNSSAVTDITTSGDGEIVGYNLSSGGSDYPYPNERRQPVAIRQTTASGITENAYGVASTNINGSIESLEIVIRGEGYVNGPANIVQSSCRAYAETDVDGSIRDAGIFTAREGNNFIEATAIPVDPNGTGAELVPLISPLNGHGSNPQKELFANYAMINLRLAGSSTFIDQDDFRRIGLIEDPIQFGTENDSEPQILEDTEVDAKYRLTLDSPTSSFTTGEIIYGETSGARGVETSILDSNTIRIIQDESISSELKFFENETVRGLDSGATATITDIESPDVAPYSGQILYINNREVVERNKELQVETITLVIEY